MTQILHDRFYLGALLAAPLFWFALLQITQPGSGAEFSSDFLKRFALITFCYPILEEAAFRGLLQGWLLRARSLASGPISFFSWANIFTTIAFTGFHFLGHPWHWALAVIIPSLLFGYFREKTGSIMPGILLHCFYNTGYFLIFTI